jgi:uncharacterized protein YfbU (UPF0304 family)
MEAKSERFEMRLDQGMMLRVDDWRVQQPDVPSRAEAFRRLINMGLNKQEDEAFSAGERFILLVLTDLFKHLEPKDAESDPQLLTEIIYGGHWWALQDHFPGVFPIGTEHDRKTKDEVVDILDMWSFIEEGFEALNAKDKAKFAEQAAPFTEAKFAGFDGNNESRHRTIARFLINRLDLFERFKGRDLNSHCPSLAEHRKMLTKFEPMRRTIVGRRLGVEELISLYQERV